MIRISLINSITLTILTVAVVMTGCSEDKVISPVSSVKNGNTFDSPNEYIMSLDNWAMPQFSDPDTVDLEPETHIASDPDASQYVCTVREVGISSSFDDIIAVGANSGIMWPGALIQGETVRNGNLSSIPLKRSPITISIDLALANPVRRIENPTSASVQQAVAELQREADVQFGALQVIPARLSFRSEEAYTLKQMMISAGFHGSFSAPLEEIGIPASAGAGFEYNAETEETYEQKTIFVKLFQPMYTISFADEEMATPGEFFDSTVTVNDMLAQEERGTIGANNLPTYVKSVTYGRMMFFSMSNTLSSTTAEMRSAIYASFKETVSNVEGSIGAETEIRYQNLRQTSTISVVAFGGSQDSALLAIRTGDLGSFFTAVPATNAVPLSYRINDLKTSRPATIGDATTYKIRDCKPGGKYRLWVTLDSVISLSGCDGMTVNTWSSWTDIADSVGPDIYRGPLSDSGGYTFIVNRNCLSTPCGIIVVSQAKPRLLLKWGKVSTAFKAPFLFPSNPYSFDHKFSLPVVPGNAPCNVAFYYTIFREDIFLADENFGENMLEVIYNSNPGLQ